MFSKKNSQCWQSSMRLRTICYTLSPPFTAIFTSYLTVCYAEDNSSAFSFFIQNAGLPLNTLSSLPLPLAVHPFQLCYFSLLCSLRTLFKHPAYFSANQNIFLAQMEAKGEGKVGESLSWFCLPGAMNAYFKSLRNKEMQKGTLHVPSVGDHFQLTSIPRFADAWES